MKNLTAIVATLLIVVTLASIGRTHSGGRDLLGVLNFASGSSLTQGGGESGFLLTNAGSSGATTITLPDAYAGLSYTIALAAAQDVNIDVQTGDKILVLTDSTGDQISSDATLGSYIELVAIDSTNWLPLDRSGTWSDAN